MLSMSAPSPGIARSSLEEMLDSIRQRDERPKDVPPTLPTRPVSRGRLPSSRRSLPVNFKIGSDPLKQLPNGSLGKLGGKVEQSKPVQEKTEATKDKETQFRSGIFGSKRMKIERPEESPYARLPESSESTEEKLEEVDDSVTTTSLSSSALPNSKDFIRDTTADYVLKKKLSVWCLIPSAKWELGRIQSICEEDATVLISDGKILKVHTENLLPANPDILEGMDNLIQLSFLNEPSVLHNLEYRYSQDVIYTKAGPVLVAINPFKELSLYGNDFIAAYRQKNNDSPHVYEIADNAFNEMMKNDINQSIIISGESGAGKTETAKVAMQYLAALGGSNGIENEVLRTNFVLECFGNAKTLKNDNSSRFGKLTEIHFSSTGKICGAKVQTFLLEKSRLVKRESGERSYHIFYQLCAGAPPSMREKLNLKTAKDYHYLKQSDCLTIEGVDDAQRFNELLGAMDIVQICKEDQENVFEMIAAVLWLGNISFLVSESECHVEVVHDEGVLSASKLLGCNIQDLILALSTRNIQAGKDNIVQKLTLAQAVDTRDALAKSIYSSLFEWLVEQINMSLGVGKMCTGRSISILDIYGFESFHKNSFEQFCINYANERLQQHFNRHLFKLEQEDYVQDGIDWTKVDFVDNVECLNLFEKRPLGLFSLLDEESTFPKASDLTFANKLKQHLKGNPFFKEERGCAFRVCHYAGEVVYHTGGFLEKNRDLLHSDSLQLLLSSKCNLPKSFALNMLDKSQDPGSPLRPLNSASDTQKQSVGTKFKNQLFRLMQQLEITTPHFIRCIKPNGRQVPNVFEHDLVLQQLRCCGVLEVVRISRSGYPTRLTHQQFAERFGFLLSENVESQDPLSVSVAILQQFNVLPDMYQVGYTKLFFRTGQIAALEDTRNRTLQGVLGVQKCFRGFQARRHFQQLRKGITLLQSFIRGERARNEFRLKREMWTAVLIVQKNVRRRIAWKLHNSQKNASLVLQSVIRGYTARKQFSFLLDLEKLKHNQTSSFNKQDNNASFMQEQDSHTDRSQVDHSVLAELHRRVLRAEAVARQKEAENKSLLQELKQYETRWSEYESKMKSMEETWQKQLTALQASLAAARKSLNSEDAATQLGKIDNSPTHLYYDSEDMLSLGNLTPEVPTTTRPAGLSDGAMGRASSGGGHHAINHLIKEFEQKRQVFEDDARFLVEVKSGRSGSDMNIDDEFRKLKVRFASWKKDYKVRLRETKMALQKLGYLAAEKSKRRWWGKRNTRGA